MSSAPTASSYFSSGFSAGAMIPGIYVTLLASKYSVVGVVGAVVFLILLCFSANFMVVRLLGPERDASQPKLLQRWGIALLGALTGFVITIGLFFLLLKV